MRLYLLPNQLFYTHVEKLVRNKKISSIYLIEHPLFFSSKKRIHKFHIFKLVLHRASMMAFKDHFSKYLPVTILPYPYSKNIQFLGSHSKEKYMAFDPVDHDISANANANAMVVDSPGFLLTNGNMGEYKSHCTQKKIQPLQHSNFYTWQLDRMKPIGITKSLDKQNRNPFPKKNPPHVPGLMGLSKKDKDYIQIAFHNIRKSNIKYYDYESKGENAFLYPVTRNTAFAWLHDFIHNKLALFGTYQDAISTKHPFLFHSMLSSSINIGLLTPSEVLQEVSKAYKKGDIPLNSYEGFVRQIIGWREYERFLYVEIGEELVKSNHFNHNKDLPIKGWYTSSPEIAHHAYGPLHDAIVGAYRSAYMHHIQRLMVVMNYMLLSGISPTSMYKWFMTFSIDAYDWVMVGNVYSMGFASTKGMRKPYISSSNYLLKMSDSKKDGVWDKEWDELYRKFVDTNGIYGRKNM